MPYRTLHRFAAERCGFGRRQRTVRVADGDPGVEVSSTSPGWGWSGPETGRRRVAHALIFTAVYSRHMFVWLTFRQSLDAVIAGCEAAWVFFDGIFKVLVPDNPISGDRRRRPGESALHRGLAGLCACVSPTRPGCARPRTRPGWSGWCSMCAAISSPARRSPIWPMRNTGPSTGARLRPCACMARRISRPSSSQPRSSSAAAAGTAGSL